MESFHANRYFVHRFLKLLFLALILNQGNGLAQDSLRVSGQLSAWGHFNPSNTLEIWSGGRYIPQINYGLDFDNKRKLDFEASLNTYGNMGFSPFDTLNVSGKLKPYRLWARYSTRQFELRAGLQKINFGSASLLRPLMWFDSVDPRDPLRLTDGVWALLARYYFLNNANIWMWGLYGNTNPKGWELMGSNGKIPEFGGRFQFPVAKGEAAFTYHHRKTYEDGVLYVTGEAPSFPENRFAFDSKLDLGIGFWLEAVYINQPKSSGIMRNQEIINLGMDYTFGIGNGLYLIYEQLLASYDEKAFSFENSFTFSLLNLSYPIGLFDNLSAIVYYDWTNKTSYNFISWQKQLNKISLYLMGYINPKNYKIPTQGRGEMLFAGTGIQIMLVFNH